MPPRKSKTEASDAGEVSPEALIGAVEAPKARPTRNEVVVEPKVKFSSWFLVKAQEDARIKAHHLETVRAYMVSQGLAAEEPARRYESALRSYFGV